MKEQIRQQAREVGFDQCRFTSAAPPEHAASLQRWLSEGYQGQMEYLRRNASKRMDPELVLPGVRSIIVVAASYAGQNGLDAVPSQVGIVARYARYQDYHQILGQRLSELARFVDRLGGPETHSLWYVDTGPVLERDLAQRAGIGFIGKHTNLISRELGNWFFLAEILTTSDLEPDTPQKNRCGTCTRCFGACPTEAIKAPFELDARRCISYLTIELKGAIPEELRAAMGNRIYGCDDCLAACPWNRFAREATLMREYARKDLHTLDLIELLNLTEEGFKARFAGTPILRAKRRGLLRNVCVALGNVGDASALPPLLIAAADPEKLIAEHAHWAIGQIERRLTRTSPIFPTTNR